ncbi:MAG: hypothetical protein FD118_676, partial [Rhodocyclaceae bacterium]
ATPAVTTIVDTIDTTTVSLTGPANVTEGAAATGYVLTLSSTPVSDVTVTLSYSGTATDGSDFTGVTTVTIPGGSTSASFNVATIDDALAESAESFTVSIAGVTGGGFEALAANPVASNVTTTIAASDNPPVTTVPVAQTILEDTAKVFSSGNGNAITVADIDSTSLTTTLSVAHGSLTAVAFAGVTISGNGTGTVTISGTAAAINGALNGLSYVNTTDYNGADTLNVSTTDGTLVGAGSIGITVTPVADIAADTVTTNEDTLVNINVNANDSFENAGHAITAINGTAIAVGGSVAVAHGSVTLKADGTLDYTPTANYNGADSFTYTVTSGGLTETATASITVTAVNDAPVGAGDTAAVNEDATATATAATGVLANDTDVDSGDTKVVSAITGGTVGSPLTGTYGTLTLNADGSYSYVANAATAQTLEAGQTANESFTYTVRDTAGATSTATLSFTITGTNDAPVANVVSATGLEDPAVPIAITLTGSDIDGTVSSFTISSLPPTGRLYYDSGMTLMVGINDVVPATGNAVTLYYQPLAEWSGSAAFDYTATDNGGLASSAATATITVTPVDDGTSVAANDGITLPTGSTRFISIAELLGNDTLFDGATITANTPTGTGTLTPVYDGFSVLTGYDFTPAGAGTTTFTYTITDNQLVPQTSTATVTLTVVPAADDFATVDESALPLGNGGGTAVTSGNLINAPELASAITGIVYNAVNYTPSGGLITITTPTGTLVVTAATGAYTYTLTSAATNGAPGSGTDTAVIENFTYTKADLTSATLHVTIQDDAATATNFTVEIPESVLPKYTLVLVVDTSGSMSDDVQSIAEDGTVTMTTRMDMAKQALVSLVSEYYSQTADVTVKLVSFESNGTLMNGGAAYANMADAIADINTLTATGGTNYEDGVTLAKQAMSAGFDATRQNIIYFISDGNPTAGNVTSPATADPPGYLAYITANNIRSYGVGIGTGITDVSHLNAIHNVDADGNGIEEDAIIVPDLNKLEEELLSTVPTAFGGNVVAANGAQNVTFGADGGYIQSISLDLDSDNNGTADTSVTFTYNPAGAGTISHNAGAWFDPLTTWPLAGEVLNLSTSNSRGFVYGTLIFNFGTGDYTYYTGGAANDGDSFDLTFVAKDADGDLASAVQTINVIDGAPEANSDTDTLKALDSFLEGNVISGMGTDGGLALGAQITDFASQGSGVDTIVDGAQVSSIVFKGVNFDLTATVASGAAAAGGTYGIANGVLTWNHDTNGSQLIFESDGYYKYIPPAADVPNAAVRPELMVSNISVTEGTSPYAVFTVGLSEFSPFATKVALALTAGTAGSGTDYGPNLEVSTDGGATWTAATTATIAAGQASVLVRTPITNDATLEAVENFTLSATRLWGVTKNLSATGTATITDDASALPTVSVADVMVDEAAGTATIVVSMSRAAGANVTVSYTTANGTATAGSDYTTTAGNVTIGTGATSATFTVPITNDTSYERAENFLVNLTGVTTANATLADAQGVVTIRDDGTVFTLTPDLTVSNPTVVEGTNTHAVFSVDLSKASPVNTTMTLALTAGTATTPADYTGTTLEYSIDGGTSWTAYAANVTLVAGMTNLLVRTPLVDNAASEGIENFTLTATRTAGLTTNASAVGTAAIVDDDMPAPILTISDAPPVVEGGLATFTWTLSQAASSDLTVNWNTVAGTAVSGTDYTNVGAGTFNIVTGATSGTFTVTTLANNTGETAVETFSVSATLAAGSTAFARVGDGTATGYIVDSAASAEPTYVVTNPTVVEGAGYAMFAINLSHASEQPVTLNLALSGTAAAGSDYTGGSLQVSTDGGLNWSATGATSVTFAAGVTSALARVATLDDATVEAAETLILTATTPAGLTTNVTASGTTSIVDDDTVIPVVSVTDVIFNEAAANVTFTLRLSQAAAQDVVVGYATGDGTATAGSDYTARTGTRTIAAGSTSVTRTVAILSNNDAPAQGIENFFLNLTSVSGPARLGDAQATCYIWDMNPTQQANPYVYVATGGATTPVSTADVIEGFNGYAVFTVGLTRTSAAAVTFALALNDGTALAGSDYTNSLEVSTNGGTSWTPATAVTIAAGQTTALVRVPILNDAVNESAENFSLTATVTAGTTLNASATAAMTIIDDSPPPVISIDDATPVIEGGTATFTVHLSQASAEDITLNWSTASGTATSGTDFTGVVGGTLTIAAGNTSGTISVTTLADTRGEALENFTVTATLAAGSTGLATLGDATATGYIVDTIAAESPTFIVSNPSMAEGADAVFRIDLSRASDADVTLDLALAGGSAISGSDFATATPLEVSTVGSGGPWVAASSVTIAAGATSVWVRTNTVADGLSEGNESFQLMATRTAGATNNSVASGTAMIVGDIAPPAVSIADLRVDESAGVAMLTVTLSHAGSESITVDWATADNTATQPNDYLAGSGSVIFSAGETSKTISILLADGMFAEATQTFNVNLTLDPASVGSAVIADAQAVVSIHDTDANQDVSATFTADPSASGITLQGIARDSSVAGSGTVFFDGANGAGVTSVGDTPNANDLGDLEALLVTFNRATYAHGVEGVKFYLTYVGNCPVTFTAYDIHGGEIGQASLNLTTSQWFELPKEWAHVGSVKILAGDYNYYITTPELWVRDVAFDVTPLDGGATPIAPEVIQYTLTDNTLDTSTATLTLNIVTNQTSGTDAANDTIAGTNANDMISGLAGDDTLSGGTGSDILLGGAGSDTLTGEADNDVLSGGDGADSLSGGAGNDVLRGDAGVDTLDGGVGDDRLEGGAGNDTLTGGDGSDTLAGGAGDDTLTGGLLSDTFEWTLVDAGARGTPAMDTVTDFDAASQPLGGDVLDLRDLLAGENHTVLTGNLANFLHFEKSGSDTTVHISSSGGFGGGFTAGAEDQTVLLQGVDLIGVSTTDQQIIQDLLTKGKLITD